MAAKRRSTRSPLIQPIQRAKPTLAPSLGGRLTPNPSTHEQPPRVPTAPARLTGMLCGHTAAVNRKWTGRISPDDASPRRHDGVHRAPNRSEPGGAGRGWGGAGTRLLRGRAQGARGSAVYHGRTSSAHESVGLLLSNVG